MPSSPFITAFCGRRAARRSIVPSAPHSRHRAVISCMAFAAALDFARRNSVEAGKGAEKAFRRIISVFERDIDDFCLSRRELFSRQRQPAHTDILSQRKAAQNAEYPLKMKRRGMCFFCRRFKINLFGDVCLHIVDCPLNALNPIHGFHNLSVFSLYRSAALIS